MSMNYVNYGKVVNFQPDSTVIIPKKFLSSLHAFKYEEETTDLPSFDEWYPLVNSYYPYTEDVDAFARVSHLVETRRSFQSLLSCASYEDNSPFDSYSERGAHEQYLRLKPTNFLIIGKPGIGEDNLGKRFADYRKCVYIDPQVLLEEEIQSNSRAGQCIEFNLRCGRAIGIDVLTRLLVKKVQSRTVKHRGFVLCGFPLIRNDLYEEDPISSESAVFNVREIFEEILDSAMDYKSPSARAQVSLISTQGGGSSTISKLIKTPAVDSTFYFNLSENLSVENEFVGPQDISTDIDKQMNILFGLFHEPFIFIYIYCENADVVSKRDHYYYDIYSKRTVDMQKVDLFFETGAENEDLIRDIFDLGQNPFSENPTLRHLAKTPDNFPANVRTQLSRFHTEVSNLLDYKILLQNHQFYIKLDGRSFISRMLDSVIRRLRTLPIQKVLLPQKFNISFEEAAGEGPQDPVENLSFDEAFNKFSKHQVVSPIFKFCWSDWSTLCPVSMAAGHYKTGSVNYAVHFMNQIFFLSDEAAFHKFYENPRKYLLAPYPKPKNRIVVIGPPLSGKTAIAKCLSYVFNYKVVTTNEMYAEFVKERIRMYIEQVRQSSLTEAIQILEDKQLLEREMQKQERKEKIEAWESKCLHVLKEILVKLTGRSVEDASDSVYEMSSFPLKIKMSPRSIEEEDTQEEDEFKASLEELNLPLIRDLTMCNQLLEDKTLLYSYLPDDLKAEIEVNLEPVNVLDEFVIKYVEDKLQNINTEEVEKLAEQDFYEQFVIGVKQFEEKNNLDGWILDGITITETDFLIQTCIDLAPIEIIILIDDTDYNFLITRFQNDKFSNYFNDFRNFFLDFNETQAALRCPTESMSDYKLDVAHEIIEDILRGEEFSGNEEDSENALSRYKEQLMNYQANITKVLDYFAEHNIDVIEVNVANLPIKNLLNNVINKVRDKYRRVASEYTDQDRAEEVQAFLSKNLGEGGEGEGDVPGPSQSFFAQNRRYGDTCYYCPVTFFKKWVLWRGKDEFTAKFEDKIYLMSSEKAMRDFIDNPRKYLNIDRPVVDFPPPRICVTGIHNSGKTTIAKLLAKNLGVRYINYRQYLRQQMIGVSTTAVHMSSSHDEEGEGDDDAMYDALHDQYIIRFLNIFWFDEPLRAIGFVVDDLPKNFHELEVMINMKAIPDAIICMTVNREDTLKKSLERAIEEWKEEVEEEIKETEMLNQQILEQWRDNRRARYNEIIEMKREQRYSSKVGLQTVPEVDEQRDFGFSSDTQISMDSVIDQKEHDETVQILDDEFPEPELNKIVVETEEEALERIAETLEETALSEFESLQAIRERCEIELINWYEIQGDIALENTKSQAFRAVDPIKFRNQSLFERCYDISLETAEKLLEQGYYFLSRFGRTCPVQYYQGKTSIQMFMVSIAKSNLYPIVHRQYIYFVVGKEARDKFMKNPLKYIHVKYLNFPLIPYRVSIIGPPKSGKTSLAKRFLRDLGLDYVSRGNSARYVLQNLPFSELRKDVEKILRRGDELTDDLTIACVHAAVNCGEGVTSGMIFDGFPNSIGEVDCLKKIGLLPHLIFDLQADDDSCLKFGAIENLAKYPQFSERFIKHLLEEWSQDSQQFRQWCDREYQNIYKVNVDKSLWGIWEECKGVSLSVLFERKFYFIHAHHDWPLRLANMIVTPLEFLERISNYKTYCPVCLHHTKTLKNGGDPPDRTGLVHFRDYFYWICDDHIEEFLHMPEAFIPPMNTCLPQDLPEVIELTEPPENPVEDGLCLVCYLNNIPHRVLHKGTFEFAVSYLNRIYLFDSGDCLKLFMANPVNYAGIVIHCKTMSVETTLNYEDLPIIGMLEQYIAGQLVKAVHHAGVNRPIIPGLSISASALICVGLHLKINNPKTSQEFQKSYTDAFDTFHQRRKDLIRYLEIMKTYLNPYLTYEEPNLLTQRSSDSSSSTSSNSEKNIHEGDYHFSATFFGSSPSTSNKSVSQE